METTTSINQQSVALSNMHTTSAIWERAEESRYGINMLMLALTIALGSMAAPYAVNLGDWQFALVLFPTVFTLILILGLAPMKMIVYTGAFAIVMNVAMFLAGVLR